MSTEERRSLLDASQICSELISIAHKQRDEIEKILPEDPLHSIVILIEIVRMRDFWEVSKNVLNLSGGVSLQDLDVMRMGWNIAVSHLFKPIIAKGFPLQESTKDVRHLAETIMYKLGCTLMVNRAVEMVQSGFLSVVSHEKDFIFKKTNIAKDQFLDDMEFFYLNELQEEIKNQKGIDYYGWELIEIESYNEMLDKPGFFLGVRSQTEVKISNFILSNIDLLMKPLLRKWDSGRGLMIEYDTTPEIDNHFLAIAGQLVHEWRNEAGFHPDIKIDNVRGSDILNIVLLIVSLHLKHIRFTALASEMFPEINIPQTLTIWEPLDKLVDGIVEFTGIDKATISKTIDIIVMDANDSSHLRNYSSRFTPLLMNLGNGFILRPVSSITRNPFFSIIPMLESRNSNIRHEISSLREEWVRRDLYAMFGGTRYQVIEGNVKLRMGNSMVTDIDACIYDNLTGELGLFQIKWQDFYFNDVKKLRSKASNLVKEMDEWCEKVNNWVTTFGTKKLGKSLRLKYRKENLIKSIYLFGISRNAARMEGYGFSIKSINLAISNWPQFVRMRHKIDPGAKALSAIFHSLKSDIQNPIITNPMPWKFYVGNSVMNFEDLWSQIQKQSN